MNLDAFSDVIWPCFEGNPVHYVEQLLTINGKRRIYKHTLEMVAIGREIAQKFELDDADIMLCCYCHDMAGVLEPSQMLEYAVQNGMDLDEAEKRYPFLLHGRFSAMMAESILNIVSPYVLSAVACHSTLKAQASKYDMALFIADKLSWDQDGIPPFYDPVYDALSTSLTEACRVYIDYVFEHDMILLPHRNILAAREWLKKQKEE